MGNADYRIGVGESVKARLGTLPTAFRLPTPHLDIFVVRGFLSAAECGELTRRIDTDLIPSALAAPSPDPEFRTSKSCNLSVTDPAVQRLEAKLLALLSINPGLGETPQGQRYEAGQQFKPHHDFFHVDQPYWPEMERTGGQRTWTAMIYLNSAGEGGQTNFPRASVKVAPVAGNLLAWNNLNAIGEPNPYSLHQGMPVASGVKYIITKWYRERPWLYSTMPTY